MKRIAKKGFGEWALFTDRDSFRQQDGPKAHLPEIKKRAMAALQFGYDAIARNEEKHCHREFYQKQL